MRYIFLIFSLFFMTYSFAQGLRIDELLLTEIYDADKPEKRKNGVYLSLFAGANSHLGNATLIETREVSALAEKEERFDFYSLPGLNAGVTLEIDFGLNSSIYLEAQGSIENGMYEDNGDEILVTTATTQAKLMFGYDIGENRNFTFRAGAGIMAYAIPLFDGDVSAVYDVDVEDIKLIPSGFVGMEWNATQWFMLGVEHRRLMNFPNEIYVRYNTVGELERYGYQVSNFRAYFRLRLMLIRY